MPIWSNPENPKVKSALNWVICVVLGLGLAKLSFSLLDKDISIVVRLFGLGLAVLTILLPLLTAKDSVKPVPERLQMKGLPKGLVMNLKRICTIKNLYSAVPPGTPTIAWLVTH